MQQLDEDELPSGLIHLDENDRIKGVNKWVSVWSGIEKKDLLGHGLEAIVRPPKEPASQGMELLPSVAEIAHVDGTVWPVLVAEGSRDDAGERFVVLFEARRQREFRERIQADHLLTQRTQTRLELVIGASIGFAEATSERDLAEVLAETTARAYAAEEAVVFLLDDSEDFTLAAGSNPFESLGDGDLVRRARELRSVLKIAGVEAAYTVAPAVGAAFEASGVQSMIIAPIHQGDQPLGLVAAFFHHPRQFDEQASPLADALAGQASRAITALRLQRRLEHAAMHDDTTGLPNRRLLEERMDASRVGGAGMLAVLFIDLDGFKRVNDQLGHPTGDRVLREVAARLLSTIRAEDVVVRYGGDEFVIVCEVISEEAANELAERVRRSVRARYQFLPDDFAIGASIGVSVMRESSLLIAADRLVRFADQAMYQAKHAGGDRIVSTVVG